MKSITLMAWFIINSPSSALNSLKSIQNGHSILPFSFRITLTLCGNHYMFLQPYPCMVKSPKIVIAPHIEEHVGKLGITQFAEDISKVMLFKPSWERHWRRNGTVTDLKPGEIMIFSFKDRREDQEDWYVIGDAVLIYEGFDRENFECGQPTEVGWKRCYHFADFRLYSKYISYNEMENKLTDFRPDARKVVHLTPEDYVRLLSLTVTE